MRTCPECSTENEEFFRFCLGCGADLDKVLGPVEEKVPVPVSEPRSSRSLTRPAPVTSSPAAATAAAPLPRVTTKPAHAKTGSGSAQDAGGAVAGSVDEGAAASEQPIPSTMVRHKVPTDSGPRPRGPSIAVEPRAVKATQGRLVLILEDGTDGAVYDLAPETTVIGRNSVDISFPHDDFLAPKHAEFIFAGPQLHLNPLPSTNGVFVQVSHEVELHSGDVFRIGQELLCFELLRDVIGAPEVGHDQVVRLGSPVPDGAWGRLGQLVAPGTWGSVYLLGGSDIYLGRERGDITFPSDGFVSGLHAVVMQRDERYFLKDLGSSNGTYYRLGRMTQLRRGALVLAGQQLFRVEH